MERFKNEFRVGWSISSNNSTGKRVLDVLKAIQLSFWKTIVQGIAEIKSWVNKRRANGLSSIEVYDWAGATKITDVVETCPRDRRNLIFESYMVTVVQKQNKLNSTILISVFNFNFFVHDLLAFSVW